MATPAGNVDDPTGLPSLRIAVAATRTGGLRLLRARLEAALEEADALDETDVAIAILEALERVDGHVSRLR